ncbi:deoxynucleoside triphosphate triphosphohydrolase [Blastocystis sp. subtype 4]|uniref:deoxynucleoside triphosphate triphosphohydrolase n=1 Tax=Blastocystis sp. subtype 4 TaxID=944170 RepID=UPI00071207E5|nr:deoxynucleoside triphosphate triphosphohydrolase [Blastocystis sp. subtype 4]KNB45854.1 deoxynucleoside triphosphate triphosphohydrolase [Blastocystis sp. subtype 4]|eukprot:XP_014529297.1 deoxynucleoside triphosphate triphosphohydrolase [Blastocystis sp. subtype 4]
MKLPSKTSLQAPMIKSLRDQVYGNLFSSAFRIGMVDIHPLCYKLILLPEFQRLRDIKQLNHLHYIYPGATHDRFQHCIGVYHLAEVFIERLQKIQPELNITEQEKLCVCVAGLYHDIGHITQCHLYPLYTRRCHSTVFEEHEVMSVRIFKFLLEKYNLMTDFNAYGLTEKEVHLICEIIMGDKKKSPKDWNWVGAPGREFLLQIVANAKSGVDVDRFDYMIRDCMNLGLHCSYNYDRIIKGAYVIRNNEGSWEICFHEKVNIDVYEMFQCRMSLHRRAYSHKSNRIIDLMIIDALCSAEQHGFGIKTKEGIVKLSEACGHLDAYIRATDYLLLQLKNSIEPEYEEARNLITRVECKQLYPFVGEVIINNKDYLKSTEMKFLMKEFG